MRAGIAVCRLSKDSWTELENRGVLEVQGADARKFLQGLTTNNMLDLGEAPATGVYATKGSLSPWPDS
jgi:folate-binding Fe-S cluster repair protein YgfZ